MTDWSIYLTPSATHRQLGLFCLGAGEQRTPPRASPERALGCHAVVFLRHGTGHLLHGPDRVLHEVAAPALLWLFPGVLHGYRPATDWDQAWALFGGPATDALTTLGQLDQTHPVRRYADPRPIERAFSRLLRITRAPTPEVQVAGALFDLIAAASADDAHDGIADRLGRISLKAASIQEYAAELELSVAELRDAVRKATGSTPQEVVLTARLNEAKTLLAESELPVAVIARQVGYDDPAYFSRLFSTRVGQSPREFRRFGSIAAPISSL
ncbi:AraC family transcriptional regulator [Kribbella qitaiheensis]|uniref:AraC family transcriptional regulator n=1 Tax=Kribbella qitaiheensis TaxID=1544730 RepID=A0A7G6X398_9ACTN|nr:helix-turn-helix transcriptional regulator [Kribbella qitaiheensis]QNE20713.1 AraC family transcriptional regulator [Kribbella qitaiheensis]